MTALVPAARWWAPLGSRTAPTRSARAAISRRAAGLAASMVYREVSTATRPPGRVRCRLLMRKWLWMECPPGLCRRSCSATLPNGTLPIDQIEGAFRGAGVGEALGQDLRLRVEGGGDGGGDRFQFHPDQSRVLGGEGQEVAGADAGLQDVAAGEAQPRHARPDRLHQTRVGVVGVERAAGRGGVLGVGQQLA